MAKGSRVWFGEVIDDGRHGPYKSHYVCFKCRKCFKPSDAHIKLDRCPECSSELWNCGVCFKPPRRNAKKKWKELQRRITSARSVIPKFKYQTR